MRDLGLILGLGRSPEEGNGNPLQYSCLRNSMDGGSLVGYSPWGCKELDPSERLHFHKQMDERKWKTRSGHKPRPMDNPLKELCDEW